MASCRGSRPSVAGPCPHGVCCPQADPSGLAPFVLPSLCARLAQRPPSTSLEQQVGVGSQLGLPLCPPPVGATWLWAVHDWPWRSTTRCWWTTATRTLTSSLDITWEDLQEIGITKLRSPARPCPTCPHRCSPGLTCALPHSGHQKKLMLAVETGRAAEGRIRPSTSGDPCVESTAGAAGGMAISRHPH